MIGAWFLFFFVPVLYNLWGTIAEKCVPSVVYRLKTVALGGGYSCYQPYFIRFPEISEMGLI